MFVSRDYVFLMADRCRGPDSQSRRKSSAEMLHADPFVSVYRSASIVMPTFRPFPKEGKDRAPSQMKMGVGYRIPTLTGWANSCFILAPRGLGHGQLQTEDWVAGRWQLTRRLIATRLIKTRLRGR